MKHQAEQFEFEFTTRFELDKARRELEHLRSQITYHPESMGTGVFPSIPFVVSKPIGTVYQRQGCIGDAYCPQCNQNFSGTCFCMLICPRCKGRMVEGYRKQGGKPECN
jgi:hypothetical protein